MAKSWGPRESRLRASLPALFATCLASFCREVCKVAVAAAVHWRRRVTVVRSTRWQEGVFFLDRSEGAAAAGDAVDHIPHGVVAADAVTPAEAREGVISPAVLTDGVLVPDCHASLRRRLG